MKNKKLIIVGAGETAEIAYEYFTYDSDYEVVAFSVSKQFIKEDTFYALPVVPLETLQSQYPPKDYFVYVAISFVKLNRIRAMIYNQVKAMGYTCASYISSKAFVWRNVEIGENVFIFENNVLQHHVKVGNNIILWSGNHVGHRSVIKDHAYLSSHCVVSGFCEIGEYAFLGVNSTYNEYVKIAKDCIVGSGALVVKSTAEGTVMIGAPAKPTAKTSYETFNLTAEEI